MRTQLVLTVALVLVVAAAVTADEIYLPANTPSSGSANVIPFAGAWPSSNTAGEWTYQWFISAKQLGGKGFRIVGLACAPNGTGTHTANFAQMQISHNTLAAPSTTFASNLPNPMTVFTQGAWSWAYKSATWSPFTLDKGASFAYNGTDNLCIELRMKGSKASSGTLSCFYDKLTSSPSRIYKYGVGAAKATSGSLGTNAGLKMRITVTRVNLTGSGTPNPGGKVILSLDAPADAGKTYQVATSLGTGPISIDTRKLGLSLDPLMVACVGGYLPSVFVNYYGKLDTKGQATATCAIPNNTAFIGVRLYSAFVTIDTGAPSSIGSISPTYTFTIMK